MIPGKQLVIGLSILVGLTAATTTAWSQGPLDGPGIVFPYEWVGMIVEAKVIREPSGIVYHPGRKTLFVVGDEGDIHEITTEGKMVQQKRRTREQGRRDYEGIAVNPATGVLYVAVEGEERIVEIDPETLQTRREFQIERSFEGKTVIKPGGQGIEGIAFVPDATHPEGGTFLVSNQSFVLDDPAEPSAIFQVRAPLLSSTDKLARASIVRCFRMAVIDLSGLHYDPQRDRLYAVSDATNTFWELSRDGRVLRGYALPGKTQEGITLDGEGYVYIAQDEGGVVKVRWLAGR